MYCSPLHEETLHWYPFVPYSIKKQPTCISQQAHAATAAGLRWRPPWTKAISQQLPIPVVSGFEAEVSRLIMLGSLTWLKKVILILSALHARPSQSLIKPETESL